MSKARSLAALGNAYDDGALSNRNKIINGSFTVSQRGDYTTATAVSNNAYSVDRWKDWSSIAVTHQNASVTINGKTYKSLKVSATASSASANIGARQFVEGINLISGETYTVHCYIRTNSASARLRTYRLDGVAGLQTDPIPSDGEWHKAELTTTYSGSINPEIGAIIYGDEAGASISAGDYVEFALVQLEVGDTATPFEHRSYGQELALCQRYYRQLRTWERVMNNGRNSSCQPISPIMRATPSYTLASLNIEGGQSVTWQYPTVAPDYYNFDVTASAINYGWYATVLLDAEL